MKVKFLSFIIYLVDFYIKYISILKPPSCRFSPTCSAYTRQALIAHGFIYGIYLSFLRLAKCHPFHSGGYDPVPLSKGKKIL